MAKSDITRVIEAYDRALNELNWIQEQFCKAMVKARNELLKARREAIKAAQGP